MLHRQMRVAFHTLGCKVNHYETEAIREAFVSRGAVSVGEEEPADVYIINTCTVTNIADRKSRQYIRRVKRINPDSLIVVTGCYAQVEPEEVSAMPEVDIVIGNGNKAKICELVLERLADRESGKQIDSRVLVKPRAELTEYEDMGMVVSGEPGMTRAYIKIQEGCDRFCAYCLIPYARGPVRSRPPADIIREAAMLVDSGYHELVLTGINTALYGTEAGFDPGDLSPSAGLATGFVDLNSGAAPAPGLAPAASPIEILLAQLDALPGDFRVRLSSLEPTVVDKDHVEKIIRYKRLCHHLHLSVQNGSDKILRSMNRHYTRDEYLEIVRAIREYDPLYGITTDIIVGFPGENEEDFADTLDVVEKAAFGKVHVFRYSPRKGTAGATLPDAVPGGVKIDRADRLEAAAARVARRFIESNRGTIHTVLAEEFRDGFITGYTDNYIKVYIEDADASRLGTFCDVELTQMYEDGCKAVLAR